MDNNQVDLGNKYRPEAKYIVLQCDNVGCKKYVFCNIDPWGQISTMYPFPSFIEGDIEGIPDDIRIDYFESCKCYAIKAYNATVVMCRRALQNIAIDKGAKKSDDLYIQLDHLRNKNIIQGILYDVARQIRTIGNDGAHPENAKVTEEDAKEINDFTWQIIEYIYLMPNRVNKIKAKKQTTQP